jgi:hypothetical protein
MFLSHSYKGLYKNMKKQLSRCVACIFLGLGAGNISAVEMTVKWEDGSPTYKAGTNYSGFVSQTHDRLGPFSGQPVHFKGTQEGGKGLIYRYRLDFDQEVDISSIIVHGAAWAGDYITLLNEEMNELYRVDTFGDNIFRTFQLTLTSARGQVFYLEEYNTDTTFRYRSNIDVDFSVVSPITESCEPEPPLPTDECSQAELDAAKEAGRQACIDDPSSCGISISGVPATLSSDFKLHIPLLHYSPLAEADAFMPMSVDMEMKDYSQLLFRVTGYEVIE